MNNRRLNVMDAQIRWYNFTGRKTMYNRDGRREFSVVIPDQEQADRLANENWPVKIRTETDNNGNESSFYYIPVEISYKYEAPAIWVTTSQGRTKLSEARLGVLENATFEKIDLRLTRSNWTNTDGSLGKRAYLDSANFTLYEDEFDRSLNNIPVIPEEASGEVPYEYPSDSDEVEL